MKSKNKLVVVVEKECEELERFDASVFELLDKLRDTPNKGSNGQIRLDNGAVLHWTMEIRG